MKIENKTNENYASPECCVILVQTEGLLCASGDTLPNAIQDYEEITYDW